MFDRFTDHAKRALNYARQHSQRLNHEYLGTEHILLGLLEVDGCRARTILESLRITPLRVVNEIDKLIKPGPTLAEMGPLPFTARAKKVLELSMESAASLQDTFIGTAHLLLGLIDEGEGVAARALRQAGLTSEAAFTIAKEMESRDEGPDRRAAAGFVLTNVPSSPSRSLDPTTLLRMAKYLLTKNGQLDAARAVDEALRLLESEN